MYHFELTHPRRTFFKFADQESEETNYFAPPCEIFDEEKSYAISLDIPGVTQDQIEVEVKENKLLVTGERLAKDKERNVRTERHFGKFSRVFALPQNVNAELIEARFENGVLDIRIPKEEKSLSKKIAIKN